MQVACQARFAAGAVEKISDSDHALEMPPVRKRKHDRNLTHLRGWRKHRQLTQEQLAERLEVDIATISRLERGEIPYNQDFLERAALALGCDVVDLLTIDPLAPDAPKLVYNRLRTAPKAVQEKAVAILDAFLKAS